MQAEYTYARKIDEATKKIDKFKLDLLKDPNSQANIMKMVNLHLLELDNPAGAIPYLENLEDDELKAKVILIKNPESTIHWVHCYP